MVARLVGLALAGPPERGTPFARALWMAAPWAFGDQELVALADRGAFEAQRELVARTADALADPGAWPVPPVLAAAWLAERGDPRGRRLLARIVAGSDDPPGDLDAVDRLALAGRLLDDLGDARAWSRAHARVARAVEDWIGAGYLPRAASAAAILAFDARVPAAPRLPLADHAAALYRDRVQRVDALTGPDAIRALVASVARLR